MVVRLAAVEDVSVRLVGVALIELDTVLALVAVKGVPVVRVAAVVLDIVIVEEVVVVATPRQMYCSSGEVKPGFGDSSLNITNSDSMLYKQP